MLIIWYTVRWKIGLAEVFIMSQDKTQEKSGDLKGVAVCMPDLTAERMWQILNDRLTE